MLTIVIKAVFWPLTAKSYSSMEKMKKLQPMMANIREKYKDDKEAMNKEVMALYKTYGVNPASGCVPILVQLPVFFGLYQALLTSIERAGIVAPSRCRSGECSWCRSKLVSGKVFVPEKTDGRRRADIEFGYIHPCASFPMSDIVLDVPNSTLK